MDTKGLIKILELMIQSEMSVEAMYRACNNRWPEDSGLWEKLISEERGHAEIIKKMIEMIATDSTAFSQNRTFHSEALKTFIFGIHENTNKISMGTMDKKRALIISRDIENSIIESKFISIVKSNNIEFETLENEITTQTIQHKALIENILSQLE